LINSFQLTKWNAAAETGIWNEEHEYGD
jgi:hypothetical protein